MDASEIRKAAILVASLDSTTAESLLAELPAAEAACVRAALTSLGRLDPAEQRTVIDEFVRRGAQAPRAVPRASVPRPHLFDANVSAATPVAVGEAAVGKGLTLLTPDSRPFEFLDHAPGEDLASLVADETPARIALVLAHLPPERAAEVLAALSPGVQAETLRALVDLDGADRETVAEVEQSLATRWAGALEARAKNGAGLAAAARILEAAEGQGDAQLLRNVARHDGELAGQLTQELLAVDDIDQLDDESVAAVFEAADPELAILALAGSSEKLVARLMRRLPRREASLMRHALENLGPTRLSDVDAARRELFRRARQLDAEGRIHLPRKPRRDG
jgi:flagellar motor switch protein FliG